VREAAALGYVGLDLNPRGISYEIMLRHRGI
jgi:hypothetical protein